MPSERVQRRIDRLLDDAEEAADRHDWDAVDEYVRAVLAADPENEDALTFQSMANAARVSAGNGDPAPPASSAADQRDLDRDSTVGVGSGPPLSGSLSTPTPTRREDVGQTQIPISFAGGRYEIDRFLGEGGKKRVYAARDTLLDREVAFALIKTEGLDRSSRDRISREAQAMGRLGVHPNIVAVLDLGQEEDGSPYIVTELMTGGDIEGLLTSRPTSQPPPSQGGAENEPSPWEGEGLGVGRDTLPLERVIEIGKAVCEGLEFAHSRGIIHRDLKPGNVWLSEDSSPGSGQAQTAKIGDFGLAMIADRSRLTREATMIGTPSYMPPEQATGGEMTPRSDLYSLGAMLYEMVTGRPPFLGDEEIAIISQHINTAPVAPTWHNGDCPRPLEALIMRLLAKDPSERPESARDVLSALNAIDLTARGETVEHDASSLESLAGGVFVGRQAEMDQLKAALEDVLGGSGRLMTLVGEPGIGKTRTSEELVTYAGLRGARVLWGRCYETGGQPPYWPWVQAIRSHVREADPDELRRQMGASASVISEIVPDVKERLPEVQPPIPLDDPDSARFRLFDSITSFLRTASQSEPIVIVLDDLHWSDRPSLTFLEFIAREIGQSRLMLLCTYRDMELNRRHPLSVTLGDLARERLYERVLLRGLTESDITRFVEIAAGVQPPAELSATVYRHTEGNPLFVTEVIRDLVQSGELAENRTSGASTWSVRIPEGVREVIGRRLDRLSERANEVLTTAAVVGRDFTLDVITALTQDTTEGQLLDVLDEALDARIIEELHDAVGHYQFTHALMQETLTGELSLTRRVRLHARIAETLDTVYGDDASDHASELAHHYGEAQSVLGAERFQEFSLLAGNQAIASHAYNEAGSIYRRATDLIDGNPSTWVQAQLHAGLGYTFAAQAQIDEAVRSLSLAFDFHAAEGDIDSAVAAAVTPFPPYAAMMKGAIDLCERALELVPETSLQAGRLLARHGQLVSLQDASDTRGSESFNKALSIASENGDNALEARILAHRTFAGIYQHALDSQSFQGLDAASLAIERAREVGDPLSEVEATYSAFMITGLHGDLRAATKFSEGLLGVAEELRDRSWLGRALNALSIIANATGDFDRSLAYTEQAESLWVADDARTLANNVRRDVELGSSTVHDVLNRIRQVAYSRPERATLEFAYYAFLQAEVGRITQDQAGLEEARKLSLTVLASEQVTPLVDWLVRCGLAIVAVEIPDPELAEQQYRKLTPMNGKWLFFGGDRLLALLARTVGNTAEAVIHHEDAIRFGDNGGYRVDLSWSYAEYAETLLLRDEQGDRERANELMDQGLGIARELGLQPLIQRILGQRDILKA